MQLNRLQMRNFKRFRHQDILFRDGITGIIGNNGAGKSTIVDAVLFCLYGLRETGVDHVISVTADPGERAEVRLDFSVRGEEYQIVRSLDRRKRHEVQVYRGGRLFARGVSDAQDALMKIVRMGHADFRHTIFSGQRELLTLVEATPESRKRWFRRVLGIDSLKEEGGEILRGETLATRDELLRIEGRLMDADADGIRKAIGEAAKGIDENGQEIHDLRAREEAHAVALASLEEEVKGHRDREKRAHGIGSLIQAKEKEAAGLETELRETGRRLAALGEYQREYMDLAGRENGFMAIQERYLESTVRARTFGELTTRISEKKARIAEVEHELTRLREE